MRRHTVWTDGSCLGNPGYGGWSAILFRSAFGLDYPTPHTKLYGSELHTTNNRMEMTAIISGLDFIEESSHVRVVTDSMYCAEGATRWHKRWIEREWKGVANTDLWHEMLLAIARHSIVEFKIVKGHSRIHWNEECDDLAKSAAKALREFDKEGLTIRADLMKTRILEGGTFEDLAR